MTNFTVEGETAPSSRARPLSNGNTMLVSMEKYRELKDTGRVQGRYTESTLPEPIVYTDESGIKWNLQVVGTANRSAPSVAPNRKMRRAAASRARRER